MIFFEYSDRIFENENTLLSGAGLLKLLVGIEDFFRTRPYPEFSAIP